MFSTLPTHGIRTRAARPWHGLWATCAMLMAGCPAGNQQVGTANNATAQLNGVAIRLVIVDDAPLAKAIRQRSGDWHAQTGSTVEILEKDEAGFLSGEYSDADAVIYPAYLLGPLAEAEAIRPISPALLADSKLNWRDVFDALRLREVMWRRQVYALPLGSPVLGCYCRADLLTRHGREPPSTWQEYQELAEVFNQSENLTDELRAADSAWFATAEPLAPGWAGLTLLARAAAYAKHPDHYSTLFDIQTMQPRIAGPPFVRALEELAAAAVLGPPNARQLTPADVRRFFHQGRCGMALTWPSAAGMTADQAEAGAAPWELAELPGSSEVFDPKSKSWSEINDPAVRHVPLLSVTGRLGSVAKTSTNPGAAAQLLVWLIGSEWNWAADVAAASADTTIFRNSHVADAGAWIESMADDRSLSSVAETIQRALNRRHSISALPIAGRDRYIAALDTAVYEVLDDRRNPAEALQAAADEWRAINENLGVEVQRRAYRHSLGLVE